MDGQKPADPTGVMTQSPLVTILIATKDRLPELRLTLSEQRKQQYSSLQMLVIDDGSKEPVGAAVLEEWPDAVVVRHETNAGQCVRRNEGFSLAKGEFILQLDDDCSLIDPTALALAVKTLRDNPKAERFSLFTSSIR